MITRLGGPRLWELGVVVIGLAYAAIYSWPVPLEPRRWVWGSHGDALGNIFEITWADHALLHNQPLTIDGQMAIPFGEQLGSLPHEPVYYWTAVGMGLMLGQVATMNLICLLSIPLSAWVMYRLALRVTDSPPAALVAGVAFGCSSFALTNSRGEPTLVQIWIFPLLALALLTMLRRPAPLTIIGAAAALSVACLVNFYYVLFTGLLATALVGAWMILTLGAGRRLPWAPLAAALATAAIGLALPALTYFRIAGEVQRASTFHRPATDLALLAPAPVDLIEPPVYNPWFGGFRRQSDVLRQQRTGVPIDFSEMTVTLPILLLAPIGALLLWRKETANRFELGALVAVVVLGLWLMVPASAVPRHRLSLQWDIYLLLPYFRAYHRAVIMVLLGACVLAAAALAWIFRRQPASIGPVVAIALVLVLVENFIVPPDAVLDARTPPEYAWINAHAGAYAIAEYPLLPEGGGGGNEYTYQFNRRFHDHPLLNGHIPGTESESMREELRDPNREGAASKLAALGVRYVLWHPDIVDRMALISESLRDPLEDQRPAAPNYRLEVTLSDRAEVWSVHASPKSFAFFAHGFGAVESGPDGAVRTMPESVGQLDVYGVVQETVQLEFRCQGARSFQLLRGDTSLGTWSMPEQATRASVSAPIAITPGISRLTLRAGGDGSTCSLPRLAKQR